MSQRSVLVFPEDSPESITNVIDNAKKSIRIKIFLFSAPVILNAIIAAKKRGVDIRVMLNPKRRNGQEENKKTKQLLRNAGIRVKNTHPDFGVTHEKSMVVDDTIAFVKSFNWDMKNLTETRDYAIITEHPDEVKEIIKCFEADWKRKTFDSGENANLIWCSGNGRSRIARFIDDAKDSLFVQNERYQDMVIIERLVNAAKRGVKVHVMAKAPHTLKKHKLLEGIGGLRILEDVGIKVHKLKHMKLHGKLLIADQKKAIIGSINLTPGSFDDRRELAIEVSDHKVMKRLHKTVKFDWKNSHQLDLTDEGLLKDLKERLDEAYQLGLEIPKEKKKKKDKS